MCDLLDVWWELNGEDEEHPEWEYKWKTNEGKIIKLKDMTYEHLRNTRNFISRWFSHIEGDGYRCLSMLQGEMAIDSVERDLARLEEEEGNILSIFDEEIRKREEGK
jgi:hypothetical protein